MKISHLKKYKKQIFFLIILILILIYCLNEHFKKQIFFKKLDGSVSSIPMQPVFLKDLTNFDWDYALLFTGEDFQNIEFYKDKKIIFKKLILLDHEGNFKPQIVFSKRAYCTYKQGKIIFDEKAELNDRGDFLYYYKPVDCSANPLDYSAIPNNSD